MTINGERHIQPPLRSRAMRLAPLFRTSITPTEAFERTKIPKTTIGRVYRVFRLIDSRMTDEEIAGQVTDFKPATVSMLRAVLSDASEGTLRGATSVSIQRFLESHRSRIEKWVARLHSSLPEHVAPWPNAWLEESWPEPWKGALSLAPRLGVENETLFRNLLEHLRSVSLEKLIAELSCAAIAVRDSAITVEQMIPDSVRSHLSKVLVRASLLYGAQLTETPKQTPTPITIAAGEDGRLFLHVGAFTEHFMDRAAAELAKSAFQQAIDAVVSGPDVIAFFEARQVVNDSVQRLRKALEFEEAWKLLIASGKCSACSALLESGPVASRPKVQPRVV